VFIQPLRASKPRIVCAFFPPATKMWARRTRKWWNHTSFPLRLNILIFKPWASFFVAESLFYGISLIWTNKSMFKIHYKRVNILNSFLNTKSMFRMFRTSPSPIPCHNKTIFHRIYLSFLVKSSHSSTEFAPKFHI